MGNSILDRTLYALDPAVLGPRLWNTVRHNWYLGFTAFGGPPVHFKIFHDLYVTKLQWIDEQVYQELFSLSQFLSGPGSTKMHYAVNLLNDGFPSAVLGFLIWSLPGALGMFGISLGISAVGDSVLPPAVYALLSGLNAATVGIIALAAVQLAEKAITDKATRVLVFLGAAAGMLYNALWYFPLLMFLAGVAAVVHDYRWLHGPVKRVARALRAVKETVEHAVAGRRRRPGRRPEDQDGGGEHADDVELPETRTAVVGNKADDDAPSPVAGPSTLVPQQQQQQQQQQQLAQRKQPSARASISSLPTSTRDLPQPTTPPAEDDGAAPSDEATEPRFIPPARRLAFSWQFGTGVVAVFLACFLGVMLARGLVPAKPLLFSLFANMLLAGTIIFGGGPVVIPLLREYVVAEGWVSPRDFLIGLALIQGFPGPNFNFAVYLGSLAALGGGRSAVAGAVVAYAGIFVPGLVTVHGTLGVWSAMRGMRWVRSALRGVNAAAVGLIYTAVYRLWQIGWIDEGFQAGTSLANDPWWVVVTASSYVGGYWFGVSPPVAIVMGAVLGLVRYGVVSA